MANLLLTTGPANAVETNSLTVRHKKKRVFSSSKPILSTTSSSSFAMSVLLQMVTKTKLSWTAIQVYVSVVPKLSMRMKRWQKLSNWRKKRTSLSQLLV